MSIALVLGVSDIGIREIEYTYISRMLIKVTNRSTLTSLSISSHTGVQLDSSGPLTAVLTLHWLRPTSIDAEIVRS